VVTEEFDPYDQPNVQVAVDDVLAPDGYHTELLGVAAGNKRLAVLGQGYEDLGPTGEIYLLPLTRRITNSRSGYFTGSPVGIAFQPCNWPSSQFALDL
jgi:hypothetical protein